MAEDNPFTRRQPPHVAVQQQIVNEHWPANPRAIPRRDLDAKKVRARVVFDGDGEVWLEGKAGRWTADHVWFWPDPYDERFQTNGVWLKPEDVYRMYDQSMAQDK